MILLFHLSRWWLSPDLHATITLTHTQVKLVHEGLTWCWTWRPPRLRGQRSGRPGGPLPGRARGRMRKRMRKRGACHPGASALHSGRLASGLLRSGGSLLLLLLVQPPLRRGRYRSQAVLSRWRTSWRHSQGNGGHLILPLSLIKMNKYGNISVC